MAKEATATAQTNTVETNVKAILLGVAQLASANKVAFKEGTARQIIAPNETMRNLLSTVCADNGLDYNHTIAFLRSMVAGESSNGTPESMTDAEVFEAFDKADKAYSRLLDARKEYKQTKKLPEGFSLEDFLNIDEVAAERQRLLKLKSRRISDAAKASNATAPADAI